MKLCLFLGAVVWWLLSTLSAAAATPKRVLILDPYGQGMEPFAAVVSAFRSTLAREFGEPVDFHVVPLDLARFTGAEGEGPLVNFLEDRIKNNPIDLVVPFGASGMQFAARHRSRLFPDTPILLTAADPRFLPPEFVQRPTALVTHKLDLAGFIEDILQMKPGTRQIAVVMGNTALERAWVEECRREFAAFSDRVNFIWLDQLPLAQVLARCAALPPDSFIFHGLFLMDSDGVPFERNEALRGLHEKANAPVFGLFESEFGSGIVGGRLYPAFEAGQRSARTAIRILQGEKAESMPQELLGTGVPRYDWRELRRWGINEANLPAGSRIEFRPPGFWEQYRGLAAGILILGSLQAGLIFGLLANRSKRRRSEAEAALIADISSKFVNLAPDQVDREILEAQRRLCEFLDIDLAALWQWEEGRPEGYFTATHLYSLQNGPQPAMVMRDDEFPWCREQMLANKVASHCSLSEMPPEAAKDRENALKLGIKSHLSLPLCVGGGPPLGVLGLNTMRAERSWPEPLVKRMQLVAQIFSNALARKRADQALRESEMRLSLAKECAGAGLWELELETQTFWASPRAREIFGYLPEEEIGMARFHQSVHPDDWARVERNIERAVQAGDLIDVEYRIHLADGSWRWILSRGRPRFPASGGPDRLLGLSMDITGRRQAEEKLHQLSLAVEQSPVLVVITDLKGRIIYVNRKFSEVTGYSPEDCLGRNPRMLKSGESPPSLYQEMWESITHGKTWQGEFRNRRKNGEIYWERASISPLLDDAGKVTHYVGVKDDITEQRRLEKEAIEQRDELFHLSRVASLGQLSGSLAHELNQPLGIILSNAQAAQRMLARENPDIAELREILADIVGEDRRAGEVILRLRALLKRGETKLLPLALHDVVGNVLGLLRSDLMARGVTVRTDLAGGLPMVMGDEVQLQQVLINLITNACDAMEENPPVERTISISTRPQPGGVCLSVEDRGCGLPDGDADRVFQPFVTTKTHGMGIGLSICRAIIAAHHGRLWAESNAGRGTTFHLELQMVEPVA
ncbi:MAG: PAS domain S-box protein [Verrucomicrobiota bacterium]